eukprot:3405373-Rhodomonas_salina.1
MSGTDIAYAATRCLVLSVCYAMPGTDIAYAATRCLEEQGAMTFAITIKEWIGGRGKEGEGGGGKEGGREGEREGQSAKKGGRLVVTCVDAR